jgi:hypothetical protein
MPFLMCARKKCNGIPSAVHHFDHAARGVESWDSMPRGPCPRLKSYTKGSRWAMRERGPITYMRILDSTNIAESAAKRRGRIKQKFATSFCRSPQASTPESQRRAEAHEAIRPTSVSGAERSKRISTRTSSSCRIDLEAIRRISKWQAHVRHLL